MICNFNIIVHHALIDGYPLSQGFIAIQDALNNPERYFVDWNMIRNARAEDLSSVLKYTRKLRILSLAIIPQWQDHGPDENSFGAI